MPKSQESKLRDSRRHTAISCFIFPIVTVASNTLYTTVYIQTEVKKLQVLCSTLSVRRFMLKSWNYSKSHCSGKSVRRRLWSKKKCLPIFYEARKSVRRHLWSKKKASVDILWSKKKRSSTLMKQKKASVDTLWSKKKCSSTLMKQFHEKCSSMAKKAFVDFWKKKCSSTVYYITLRKISANGSEARQISHNKVQTFFCLTT